MRVLQKATVRLLLFRHGEQVVAVRRQRLRDRSKAAAVQRGVDDLERVTAGGLGDVGGAAHRFDVGVIHFLRDKAWTEDG